MNCARSGTGGKKRWRAACAAWRRDGKLQRDGGRGTPMKEGDDGMLEDVLQDEARHEEQADGVSIDGNIDDLQGMAAYCTARSVLDETNNGKRGWHDAETCQGGW
jgi:hypothetical protein